MTASLAMCLLRLISWDAIRIFLEYSYDDLYGHLDAIRGVEDHVHILCGIPARLAVSNMLRAIKSSSSKWINDNRLCMTEFRWQRGFAAFSVSKSNMPEVTRYLAGQEEHHRKISFAEEYRALLIRHEIPFDEKYLFDDEHTG